MDFIKNDHCIGGKITQSLLAQASRNYTEGNPDAPTGFAEMTLNLQKDISTYKLGMCQLCSLMYEKVKKSYKGQYYMDIEGPAKLKRTANTTLATAWVEGNFTEGFLASVKAIANKKRSFLYVPAGKARSSKKSKTEGQTNLDHAIHLSSRK